MSTPQRPSGGRIKGAPLRAMLEHYAHLRSVEQVRSVLATLSEDELRATCPLPTDPGFGILASGWYSAIGAGKVIERLWEVIPEHERDAFTVQVAHGVMAKTLSGAHKAVFRVVGSPSLMQRYPMVFWKRQYDSGDVLIETVGKTVQRHTYTNWMGHHPIICKLTFECVPVMFKAMGMRSPEIEIERCAGDGVSSDCSAIVRWDG